MSGRVKNVVSCFIRCLSIVINESIDAGDVAQLSVFKGDSGGSFTAVEIAELVSLNDSTKGYGILDVEEPFYS